MKTKIMEHRTFWHPIMVTGKELRYDSEGKELAKELTTDDLDLFVVAWDDRVSKFSQSGIPAKGAYVSYMHRIESRITGEEGIPLNDEFKRAGTVYELLRNENVLYALIEWSVEGWYEITGGKWTNLSPTIGTFQYQDGSLCANGRQVVWNVSLVDDGYYDGIGEVKDGKTFSTFSSRYTEPCKFDYDGPVEKKDKTLAEMVYYSNVATNREIETNRKIRKDLKPEFRNGIEVSEKGEKTVEKVEEKTTEEIPNTEGKMNKEEIVKLVEDTVKSAVASAVKEALAETKSAKMPEGLEDKTESAKPAKCMDDVEGMVDDEIIESKKNKARIDLVKSASDAAAALVKSGALPLSNFQAYVKATIDAKPAAEIEALMLVQSSKPSAVISQDEKNDGAVTPFDEKKIEEVATKYAKNPDGTIDHAKLYALSVQFNAQKSFKLTNTEAN